MVINNYSTDAKIARWVSLKRSFEVTGGLRGGRHSWSGMEEVIMGLVVNYKVRL